MMNRWNTRNMLNKRDAFELKRNMECNYELLQRIEKQLKKISKTMNRELEQILKQCRDSREGYGNVEILLKALMVDSLLKEIGDENGTVEEELIRMKKYRK